jgi:hypothetical protein
MSGYVAANRNNMGYYPEHYNKYYKKCRLVENPQLWIEKNKLTYKDEKKRVIGWVSEQYAKEGNLLKIGDWKTTYLVVKVFPSLTTKKYIDKLQEPILA